MTVVGLVRISSPQCLFINELTIHKLQNRGAVSACRGLSWCVWAIRLALRLQDCKLAWRYFSGKHWQDVGLVTQKVYTRLIVSIVWCWPSPLHSDADPEAIKAQSEFQHLLVMQAHSYTNATFSIAAARTSYTAVCTGLFICFCASYPWSMMHLVRGRWKGERQAATPWQ